MNIKTQRTLSVIFSLLSSLGTVGTAILAVKYTPKAMKKLEELKTDKINKIYNASTQSVKDAKKSDKKEKIKYNLTVVREMGKIYWPAILSGIGTIASTTTSLMLSRKTEASLIATTTLLSNGWRRYRSKVKDFFGIDADKLISDSMSIDDYHKIDKKEMSADDGKKLYWNEYTGFFKCSELDMLSAMMDLNQRLHAPDTDENGTFYFTTLEIFLKDAKAEVFDKRRLEACKNIGWTSDYLYSMIQGNCVWVHPYYTKVCDESTGEIKYTKISFWEEPIAVDPTQLSRFKHKTEEDYIHEAELDMQDAAALDLYENGYEKHECDLINDHLDHLILSNPSDRCNYTIRYLDGSSAKNNDNSVDYDLPKAESIPE